MRVLAHVHSFNDADVIEQLLEGLRGQTRPPDAMVVVDNASTDRTLDRTFPDNVTIIRNPENLGTSGAIRIGFDFAIRHKFDWTWVFDADSVPAPDALHNLLAFFAELAPAKQDQVCFVAGWPLTDTGDVKQQPLSLEKVELIPLAKARDFTQCDCMIWSGTLYRMAAVERIGLPSADYVFDMGELEYGYRARRLGFTSYVVHNGIVQHDVGRSAGAASRLHRFGPISVTSFETSPMRTYYSVRNVLHFWLYLYKPRRIGRAIRWVAWRAAPLAVNFARRPRDYAAQLRACFRGIWHGVTGNIAARY